MNKFDMKYVESEFGNYVCFNKEKWTSKDVIEKPNPLHCKNESTTYSRTTTCSWHGTIQGVNDLMLQRP